jgi:hypothetical protein
MGSHRTNIQDTSHDSPYQPHAYYQKTKRNQDACNPRGWIELENKGKLNKKKAACKTCEHRK